MLQASFHGQHRYGADLWLCLYLWLFGRDEFVAEEAVKVTCQSLMIGFGVTMLRSGHLIAGCGRAKHKPKYSKLLEESGCSKTLMTCFPSLCSPSSSFLPRPAVVYYFATLRCLRLRQLISYRFLARMPSLLGFFCYTGFPWLFLLRVLGFNWNLFWKLYKYFACCSYYCTLVRLFEAQNEVMFYSMESWGYSVQFSLSTYSSYTQSQQRPFAQRNSTYWMEALHAA